MNAELEKFARNTILTGLEKLPPDWQRTFKLMYGRAGGQRSVEDAVRLSLLEVVENIESQKLDWAMTQIENSINKLNAAKIKEGQK